jgi:adenine phosphoribosyltransferase
MDLANVIAAVPDFPRPGILFRDITPVFQDPVAYAAAIDGLADLLAPLSFDAFAAVESRGFLLGGPLALRLGKGLILVRKAGKLPRATRRAAYALEYGEAVVEMHDDACRPGQRVVILDDLLATGGTAAAAAELVRGSGAEVAAYLFMVELEGLAGRRRLAGAPVFSLVVYP